MKIALKNLATKQNISQKIIMKKLIFTCVTTLSLGLLSFQSSAQSFVFNSDEGCITNVGDTDCISNAVISAMPFLRIAPDARGGAMGDVGIALSPNSNAMHYNASNLVYAEEETAMSVTYTPWLRELNLNDIYLAYLSGYKKIDDLQTVGFGLRYFSLGEISFTDNDGVSTGSGRPREFEISGAYARKLSDKLAAGLTAKYIYSNLASGQMAGGLDINSANAFAADFSLTYRSKGKTGGYNSEFAMGLALTNIGTKVSYTNQAIKDFLPSNLGLGSSLKLELDDFNTVEFALDVNKLMVPTPVARFIDDNDPTTPPLPNPEYSQDGDDIADFRQKSLFSGLFGSFSDAQGGLGEELREFAYSFGVEYWYDKQFAVRAGYYYENEDKGDRKFLTVGLGLKYNVFGIDLSYLVPTSNQRNPLDNTLRFGLVFDFASYSEQNALVE